MERERDELARSISNGMEGEPNKCSRGAFMELARDEKAIYGGELWWRGH